MLTHELDNSDDVTEAVNETSWENLGSLPKPQGGFSAGGRALQGPGRLGQAQDPDRLLIPQLGGADDVTGAIGNGTSWDNLGSLPRPGGVSAGGYSQGGGGVIVCPGILPAISFEKLATVAQPRRAGTPGGNQGGPGRTTRRDRP